MKKCNPWSTAETMKQLTSPYQKHCESLISAHGFTVGLVAHFLSAFNVSQVDTFIEKPSCSLNLFCFMGYFGNLRCHVGDSGL